MPIIKTIAGIELRKQFLARTLVGDFAIVTNK